jgi:serine/threonine protein phosphatase 1
VFDHIQSPDLAPFPVDLYFESVSVKSHIDRLTYAIGDVHGRNDLLLKLLEIIRFDAIKLNERPRIIFLGDYIDRGAQSKAVVDTIVTLKNTDWCDVVVLMGNHEKTLLNFLHNPIVYGPRWLEYGARPTFQSYGVKAPASKATQQEWDSARKDFIKALLPNHINLFLSMPFSFTAKDYLFVHAGVDPTIDLSLQGPETLLWIRAKFLTAEKSCGFVVVHGHTTDTKPDLTRWRIGVDTGAYATGVLSAVKLSGDNRDLIQAV